MACAERGNSSEVMCLKNKGALSDKQTATKENSQLKQSCQSCEFFISQGCSATILFC